MKFKDVLGDFNNGCIIRSCDCEYRIIDGVPCWRWIGEDSWTSMISANELEKDWEIVNDDNNNNKITFECEECGKIIEEQNEYGDFICEDCKVYCTRCGDYCYQESNDGMCEDCYEDYLEDLEEDEDE